MQKQFNPKPIQLKLTDIKDLHQYVGCSGRDVMAWALYDKDVAVGKMVMWLEKY